MVPGGWPCPFKRIGRPHLRTRRSAVGLVRDWDDGLWVLGGWGGQGQQERALTSTETWTVERLGQEGLGAEESAVEHVVDSGDEEEGTLPGVEDSQEEEGAGGQQGEGVGEAVVEEQNPDGQGEAADDGRARWQPQWARSREWVIRSDMQTPRCFLAATMDPAGGILAIGALRMSAGMSMSNERGGGHVRAQSQCHWASTMWHGTQHHHDHNCTIDRRRREHMAGGPSVRVNGAL